MKTIAFLFGGASTEHEVSRMSATSVISNADSEKYRKVLIGITKDGRWLHYTGPVEDIITGAWETNGHTTQAFLSPDSTTKGLVVLGEKTWEIIPIDVVFPVLHGRNGEDGTIQGLLDMAGIPYVGCGVIASANCMDKAYAKIIFTACGIPNARWIEAGPADLDGFDTLESRVAQELAYPVFVKPANSGSSVGVSKADDKAALRKALVEALDFDSKVVIEECLRGHEVEAAVMGNHDPIVSDVVGEIVPVRGLYDYEGKYLDGSTELFIPARIDAADAQQMRELAKQGYKALGCTGLSRVDFFVLYDAPAGQRVILNEINTLPGFTNISMYPKLFMASGLSYSEIIDRLIGYALERAGQAD